MALGPQPFRHRCGAVSPPAFLLIDVQLFHACASAIVNSAMSSPKSIANFEKHGVPFEEAATVFADAYGLDWDDPGTFAPGAAVQATWPIGEQAAVAHRVYRTEDRT
jgi:hypothetical protein